VRSLRLSVRKHYSLPSARAGSELRRHLKQDRYRQPVIAVDTAPARETAPAATRLQRSRTNTRTGKHIAAQQLRQGDSRLSVLTPVAILTNALCFRCGRKETWYSCFVGGG